MREIKADVGQKTVTLTDVELREGPGRLETWIGDGESARGVVYAEIRRR
jgi:hypothetical protein